MICTALTFFSCEKTVHLYVQKVDREMIPYQTGDTVRFFNEREELITLVVTKDTKSWYCPFDEKQYVEQETVGLESDSGNYKLSLTIEGLHEYLLFGISFSTNHTGGIAYYNSKGDLRSGTLSSIFDSLLIGNHIYYNVSVSDETPTNGHMQSFYNKEYGVLQMMLDEKTVFTLDTVIFAREL